MTFYLILLSLYALFGNGVFAIDSVSQVVQRGKPEDKCLLYSLLCELRKEFSKDNIAYLSEFYKGVGKNEVGKKNFELDSTLKTFDLNLECQGEKTYCKRAKEADVKKLKNDFKKHKENCKEYKSYQTSQDDNYKRRHPDMKSAKTLIEGREKLANLENAYYGYKFATAACVAEFVL